MNKINGILSLFFLFLVGILCICVVYLGLYLWNWYDSDKASLYLNIACLTAIVVFSFLMINGLILPIIDEIITIIIYHKLRKLFVKGERKWKY